MKRRSEDNTVAAVPVEPDEPATGLSRRDFLRWSALAGVGTAAGSWQVLGPAGALGGRGVFVALAQVGACPLWLQSGVLGMAGLGNVLVGGDGEPLPYIGNHLRWAFASPLGFPSGGFDLYRRPRAETRPVCVTPDKNKIGLRSTAQLRLGDLLLTSTAGVQVVDLAPPTGQAEIDLRDDPAKDPRPPLFIYFPEPCHRITFDLFEPGAGGSVQAVGYDQGAVVAAATSSAATGAKTLVLEANRIDQVALQGTEKPERRRMNALLLGLCYQPVAATAAGGGTATATPTATATRPTATSTATATATATATSTPTATTRPRPTPPPTGGEDTAGPGHALRAVVAAALADLDPACGPWVKLNKLPIGLPLPDPAYPFAGRPADAAAAWALARSRLDGSAAAQLQPVFGDLTDLLARIYTGAAFPDGEPDCPPSSATDSPVADFGLDPLQLTLLSALDADIARADGLYWIDGPLYVQQGLQSAPVAAQGVAYDYMVVAHYGQPAAPALFAHGWEGPISPFEPSLTSLPPGTTTRGPMRYTTPIQLSVASHPVAAWATTKALAIPDLAGTPLTIRLPEPVEAVELWLDLPDVNGAAIARALAGAAEVDVAIRPAGTAGPTKLLLLGPGIDTVLLECQQAYLVRTIGYRPYAPSGDIAYIAFNVTLAKAPALAAPTGLTAAAVPVLTHEGPDCAILTGQAAAGLRWDLPLATGLLLPTGPVLYNVDRAGAGNGASATVPAPTSPSWQKARYGLLPSRPGQDATCDPLPGLPGWPVARPLLVDTPPNGADRWQAYRVHGVSLFGQATALTNPPVAVELRDTVAPPPPADFHAKYLDPTPDPDNPSRPADRSLTPSEWAWVKVGGGRHGLRLRWRWTANLAEQAPDAAEFRVYTHPGRRHLVIGLVTAVSQPNANQEVVITTDRPAAGLPSGDLANAFRGDQLIQGPNHYPIVASGSAGGFLTLTYRQLAWSPNSGPGPNGVIAQAPELQPPPAVGQPFSLSIRPMRPLRGMLTGVAGGAGPVITVMTDVRYPPAGQPNPPGMAGKDLKLAQGGVLWDITGNSFGWKFTMTLARRDCAPFAPRDGEAFEVLEPADQPGFYRAFPRDPGNPHWRDFSDPRTWKDRLLSLPAQGPIRGAADHVDLNAADGTSTVYLKISLANWENMVGGDFETDGGVWPVLAVAAPDRLLLANARRDPANGTVTKVPPPVVSLGKGGYAFWPDIAVPLVNLPTAAPTEPVAWLSVGVSTADDKAYIADPRPGGGRTGNEGRLAPAASVMRVNRTPPPVPTLVTGAPLVATPADFLGQSFIRLRFRKTRPEDRYRVYRALADVDAGSGAPVAPAVGGEDYILITPEPVRPDDPAVQDVREKGYLPPPTPLDPNVLAYRDTLDGRTRSKYYYIVRAESPAGLLGPPAGPIGPVSCPDVVPPGAPALAAVYGQEDAIRLEWAASPEPDLAEYRVYRVEDPALAVDLRSMTRVATVTGSPPAPEHVDTTVTPLRPYTYRVLAVDASGNVSAPSAAATGRAIHTGPPPAPDAPALQAQWQGSPRPRALLTWGWSSPQPGLQVRVERRAAGSPPEDYRAVSDGGAGSGAWLAPGVTAWVDRPPSGQSWVYRLIVRNAFGITSAGNDTPLT